MNNKPSLANPISNQTYIIGSFSNRFDFIFESNTFNDTENDTLNYDAYYSFNNFATQDQLKENVGYWLQFDRTSRRFFGTPNLTNITSNSLGK
jgi:hypothetical protein